MKYIDAEKLIAEIEFAKSVYDNPKRVIHGVADAFRQDGRAAMCDDILKKIASIQQEHEIVELSFKGGTYRVNGEEHAFKGGKAKVIILEINQEEENV